MCKGLVVPRKCSYFETWDSHYVILRQLKAQSLVAQEAEAQESFIVLLGSEAVLGSAEAPRSEREVPVAPKAFAGPLIPAPAALLPATDWHY